MIRRTVRTIVSLSLAILVGFSLFVNAPKQVEAAASLSVTASSPVRIADTISVGIYVNTGGQYANSFDLHFSYPANLLDPVRGSTTGSVCSIWITQPDPNGGGADISCGKPGGFNGSGLLATIYLSAKLDGSATFGLSNCSVLANDGQGTDITGGCSGRTITINPDTVAATPPPSTPVPNTPVPTLNPVNTPKPVTTPRPPATPSNIGSSATPKPAGTTAPTDTAKTPTPTATPTPPPAVALPSTSPTPSVAAGITGTDGTSGTDSSGTQKRTISTAFSDVFKSLGNIKSLGGDTTGLFALLLAMIPVLGLFCAILFFIYRLFALDKQRRRSMDRLFEMELSELAALEGKMDLLAEKGTKGREQYREEFRLAKEHILRQIKPDYAKPVEPEKPSTPGQ